MISTNSPFRKHAAFSQNLTIQKLVTALVAVLLCMTPVTDASAQQSPPVWGFADLHAHPASHLAFGANDNGEHGIVWGKPGMDLSTAAANISTDLPPCLTTNVVLFPSPDPITAAVTLGAPIVPIPMTTFHGAPGDYVQWETQRQVISQLDGQTPQAHHEHGAPGFQDWPGPLIVEHQQMHITAIKHAYDGGLRLMIAATVDTQLLSVLWTKVGFNLIPSVPHPDPNFDYNSAVKQLNFVHSLVAANSSWMQIVKTPAEARQAINANKLAVILSLEMDALTLDQILALTNGYDVRHVIPIHLANSPFGGSAVYNDDWNTNSWFLNNHQFVQVNFDPTISFKLGKPNELQASPPGAVFPWPISDGDYAKLGYTAQSGGHKNGLGISDPSGFLQLMQAGLLIDVAHMSERATEMALTQAEIYGYPLMDSHTGIRDPATGPNERSLLPSHATRIGNLRGVIGLGPSWNQNSTDPISDFLTAYENALPMMGGRGIALGTDANGLQPLMSFAKLPLQDYKGNVAAKFGPPAGVATPDLGHFQLGTRSYDLKTDGLANYGMLPDFLEALSEQSTVKPAPSVTGLFHSAEDVIQMWEKVVSASSNTVPPPQICKQPDYQTCLTTADNQYASCYKQAASSDPLAARCDVVYNRAITACSTSFCRPTQPTQLSVTERVFPSMDTGRFKLSIDGSVELANVGDQANTGFVTVGTGVHTVIEGATTGTNLVNYTVQFGGDCLSNDTSQGPDARPVTVGAGQQKTCTITNNGFPAVSFQFTDQSPSPGSYNIQIDGANVATSATANSVTSRVSVLTSANHQISVTAADSNTNLSNYAFQFGRDCTAVPGNKTTCTVSLGPGDEKTARIIVQPVGVGGCPAGQKPCGDAPGLPGDPMICVMAGASCNALCKPNSKGVPGTFCDLTPTGGAICVYKPAVCP